MRHLAWFTGGLAGILFLGAYVDSPTLAAGLFFLGGTVSYLLSKNKKVPILMALGGILGACLFYSLLTVYLKPLDFLKEQTRQQEILITEASQPAKQGSKARGILYYKNKPYRVALYYGEEPALSPGDRVYGSFHMKVGDFRKPGTQRHQAGQGIFISAFAKGEFRVIEAESRSLLSLPGKLSAYGKETMDRCLSPEAAGFARALVLGDSSRLEFQDRWNLRTSGISHLIAVSGLHVTILCMVLSLLTLHNKWLTAILGFPVLLLFGAITGFSPSVVRASLMMSLLLLSRLLGRRYDPITELSGAALLILILNPLTVLSVSFQLSCASVLGIFCFYGKIRFYIERRFKKAQGVRLLLQDWISGSLAVSFSSLVFVTPLAAAYFGSVSLIAPLTNLLAVWLVPFLFAGLLLMQAVSLFSLGAALVLGRILSIPISFILLLSQVFSEFPLAAVYVKSPWILFWLIFVYVMGIYLLRGSSKEVIYFSRFSLISLLFCLTLSWLVPSFYGVQMTAFDVGQGQCIFLRTEGKSYLVDCGGDREEDVAQEVLQTLKSQGIFHLDGLILTHFDYDHIGAADEIYALMDVKHVYVPESNLLPPVGRLHVVKNEKTLPGKQAKIRIIGSESAISSNEMGLCVLLESPKYDILITGDRSEEGEKLLLSNHSIPQVDCLIAGHHGAKDSASLLLLEAVRPDTVVISAGRNNRYGHPAGETLLRLRNFGCRVLRTDLDGSITIRR